MTKRIALVTGANRGLGLETARQLARLGHHVVLSGRHLDKVEAAVAALQADGLAHTEAALLDVTDDAQAAELVTTLLQRHRRIDILVNNAGQSFNNSFMAGQSVFEVTPEEVLAALAVNTLGPYRLTRLVLPHMNRAGYGRVVNLSSGLGQLSGMGSGSPAYQVSKTALNAVTRLFAAEARGDVKINSVCPGWTRTDMGGPSGARDAEEGATGIVWAATLPSDGPNGGFFRDGEALEW